MSPSTWLVCVFTDRMMCTAKYNTHISILYWAFICLTLNGIRLFYICDLCVRLKVVRCEHVKWQHNTLTPTNRLKHQHTNAQIKYSFSNVTKSILESVKFAPNLIENQMANVNMNEEKQNAIGNGFRWIKARNSSWLNWISRRNTNHSYTYTNTHSRKKNSHLDLITLNGLMMENGSMLMRMENAKSQSVSITHFIYGAMNITRQYLHKIYIAFPIQTFLPKRKSTRNGRHCN